MSAKAIRLEGFRNFGLPEWKRVQFETAETMPLDMSVDGILSSAKTCTGLVDFGPSDFQERLGRLLSEVEADTNVWRGAKAGFIDLCIRAATNRLRSQEFLRTHPEVHDVVIDQPIIIVGLPRSGTTHLQNLIAADPRVRYLPAYLGAEPVPIPSEKPGVGGPDPRWGRADERWKNVVNSSPVAAAMHDHSPDHACGDTELQMADFASYHWEAVANVPMWRDYYLRTDQTPHYIYARTMLKAIVYQQPDRRRWILKGIQNSEQLRVLANVYPDAIIVMTHRDPLAILQSVLTLSSVFSVFAKQKVPDLAANTVYWVDRMEYMLRAYMRDMDVIPRERRVDILFHEFMADDIATAQRTLEVAGLPLIPASMDALSDYMRHHTRYKAGRVIYDLTGDFGLDVQLLRDRFRFYTDRFPVRSEVG